MGLIFNIFPYADTLFSICTTRGGEHLTFKDGILYAFNAHAAVIQEKALLRQTLLPRLAASRFPPASKLTGIQRSSLRKALVASWFCEEA